MTYKDPEKRRESARNAKKKWRADPANVEKEKVAGRKRDPIRKIKSRYGLEADQFHALLIHQAGRCAICRTELSDSVVDHDHVTGEVRGLLCRTCNTALGGFRDSPATLYSAIEYLNEPPATAHRS